MLAATSVDDLVDILDVSLDEAEAILTSAKAIVEAAKKSAVRKLTAQRSRGSADEDL